VEVVASLPCYLEDNVDRQRGKGVFEASIRGLRKLNELGYGRGHSGLVLNLVFNPQGPALPPPQAGLEADYRRHLGERYGIAFNRLYVLTNMPIQRFGSMLISKGKFEEYMTLLKDAYRPENLESLRLQPDAGAAARLARQAASSSARADRRRPRGQSDRGQESLLRLHRRAGIQLRRRAFVTHGRCRCGTPYRGPALAVADRPEKQP
jgi:hypothetical protein